MEAHESQQVEHGFLEKGVYSMAELLREIQELGGDLGEVANEQIKNTVTNLVHAVGSMLTDPKAQTALNMAEIVRDVGYAGVPTHQRFQELAARVGRTFEEIRKVIPASIFEKFPSSKDSVSAPAIHPSKTSEV